MFPRDKTTATFDAPVEGLVLGVVADCGVGQVPIDARELFDVGVCDYIIRV